jgi:hypothetical protein
MERMTLLCPSIPSGKSTLRPFWGLRWTCSVIRALLAVCMICTAAGAGDKPFDMSSNWGGTGLMEIPTARILPDGVMRLGRAQASPYIWHTFGFGVLPGLEFTGRYTDITNRPSGLESDFGSYKDKAYDLKYQLLPESRKTPAVAIGISDFNGTRLYEAQYLVISRQLFPVDFTLGCGRQRLKGPLSIGDEIGFWGGLEWAATERLHLMVEYNPIEYHKDPLVSRGVPEGSSLPFNVGLRYRTWMGFDLGLSYQRGDAIGLAVHLQFELGRPILPPKPDPPSWEFAIRRPGPPAEADQRVRQLSAAVQRAGFTDVAAEATKAELTVEFENHRYLSDAQAAGRVLRLLLSHADRHTQRLTVVMKSRGLKILYISVGAEDTRRYLMGDLTADEFARRLMVSGCKPMPDAALPPAGEISAAVRHAGAQQRLSYGIDPTLESFFNDPSGAYHSRLALNPNATLRLWPGGALHGSYAIPLNSDVETTADVPSDAVRSDAWKYLGSRPTVNRLLFDQIFKLAPPTYARFTAGYLERMYAGAGGEVLTYLDQGRWALGLEGDWVRKREPEEAWDLTDQQNHTLLGNIYYRYLPLDVTLKAQAGRFLAGDRGARLEFRRRFDTGAEIGFWYSLTDTRDFTDFNRDYNDQGIFLSLPFATFTDHPTRKMLHFNISPWTRDVGATIDHWQEIHDNTADLTPMPLRRDLDHIDD